MRIVVAQTVGKLKMVTRRILRPALTHHTHAAEGHARLLVTHQLRQLSIEVAVMITSEQPLIRGNGLVGTSHKRMHLSKMAQIFLVVRRLLKSYTEEVGHPFDVCRITMLQVISRWLTTCWPSEGT